MFEKNFKLHIYIKSFILSSIIIIILNLIFVKTNGLEKIGFININNLDKKIKQENIILENIKQDLIEEKEEKEKKEKEEEIEIEEKEIENIDEIKIEDIYYWHLEIPAINLSQNIDEGTSSTTLDEYIGHFEMTPIQKGNICLASHNRGYKGSFFGNIKDLNIDDIIIYYINNLKYEYRVISKQTILETDWEKLKNTHEDYITLVTCVEDVPNYRRIVQAKKQ